MTAELFISPGQLLIVACCFGSEMGHRMGPTRSSPVSFSNSVNRLLVGVGVTVTETLD